MKILLIHSDYLEYEVKKNTPVAEDISESMKQGRMEECLSIFTTVEKNDEGREKKVADKGVAEIEKVAEQLGVEKIMLYPYAHLSPELSSPDTAVEVLKEMETILSESYTVHRSPFGWYKAFKLSCKGHPLSELSKEITAEGGTREIKSKALTAEEDLESTWGILDPDGTFNELDVRKRIQGYDFNEKEKLEQFIVYESGGKRTGGKEPPHIKLMHGHELVDYEPGSDPGNLRYYPKGRMMKGLLEDYVSQMTREYGAMEIESPIMYDMDHPTLKSYLDRFPARQYSIETPDKNVFLRFAACFGQFLMAKDMTISYKNLPLRIYELTRYSFRVEQRGEISGLRRQRAFTMPDSHAMCRDMNEAKKEMLVRMKLAMSILKGIGVEMPSGLELGIRCTRDFFEEHRGHLIDLVKTYGKPALVEIWEDQFFYFVLKYEFNYIDPSGRASALVTDQIDVENAARYGITYVDEGGKEKHPYILHLSPSGGIERVMFTLLEKAAEDAARGVKPSFPYWLAPTQLRLLPVSEDQMDFVENLADEFDVVRVDIDDTNRTVGRKVREAEKEWIPYIVIIGSREVESNKLSVRVRESGEQVSMDVKELKKELNHRQAGLPFRGLPLPRMLSQRPVFVG
ncbi:MAG: threonine--tRNA ligase [Thermoplasmata archaeon]